MNPQPARGRYDYYGADDQCVGHEVFSLERAERGIWVLNSTAIMNGGIRRDVTYAVDDSYRPRDCYARVVAAGSFLGAAWFWFGADGVSCERVLADGQRRASREAPGEAVTRFGTHAVITDGWFAAGADAQLQAVHPVISVSEDGARPPELAWSDVHVQWHGESGPITTPAGDFEVRHCSVAFAQYPPLEMWLRCTDGLCVRQRWDFLQMQIELAVLSGAS